ncbi:GATA transcription factor 16-like [Rhodamnia argentea]|uniref:GATA transcription factor 16-like n=1 Tax=Rhodamnia argentea TaxID=178133 RepID=A0A8B8QCN5_9MYRT|nr:GATA transcription factor 16-like [Rhodamnia argentea]
MDNMTLGQKEPEPGEASETNKKFCADCKTTKTPLWRGGPSGPKSLCNACGIRYRKKRILSRATARKRERHHHHSHVNTTDTSNAEPAADVGAGNDLSHSLKMRLAILGKDLLLQTSFVKKQRCQRKRKLGEEEQAAVSLMALSCGSVSA